MSTPIPSTAQAWRYPPTTASTWNGYHSLQLKDIPVPSPGKGQVLVKLHAVALNDREILVSQGAYSANTTTGLDGEGLIPGCDGAGEIVALGPDVTTWQVGDRVHSLLSEAWIDGPLKPEYMPTMLGSDAQGCLTQYRIFPADFILPIPSHLTYEQATTLPCAGITAWNALFGGKPTTKDSTILVQGSGGVSVFAAQIAKALGARVIATTSSQAKAEKYKALGVDDVIDYKQTPEWATKVRELTGGEGVDSVVEIGGEGTMIQSIQSVRQQGQVNVVGFLAQPAPGQPSVLSNLAQTLIFSEAIVRGVIVGGKTFAQRLDEFIGKHKIEPVVDKVFGWREAVEAHAYLESGAHFGKVVIRVE